MNGEANKDKKHHGEDNAFLSAKAVERNDVHLKNIELGTVMI
jgi:hypothetical protein